MSDPGAVERNNQYAQIALDRARIRNGGNGVIPQSQPDSVVANGIPAQAADRPVPFVGSTSGGGE